MAGVSMKDIRSRIKSMGSTRQITKAMEMVASSKLRQAQERAIASRPYFEVLYQTMHDIADANTDLSSPYVQPPRGEKTCFVVIAGDRGLAGGYNSNVLKLAVELMQGKDAMVLPVGKKATEYFKTHGVPLLNALYPVAETVNAGECFTMANGLCREYLKGTFDQVVLCYTNFVTVLTQEPGSLPLLPLSIVASEQKKEPRRMLTTYEPSSTAVFDAIVPEFLGGVIYGALRESLCSEQAARRTAMDSATKNADEMIADLSLQYNRARQSAITQEITEIVAGAEQ
ncbi:MAG: ATP synthase F1 subunit gamma [Oscillospiraceae bacterium]|nr:ATP synthase F1 subunit gamma [Oscillospiraceae bacterium]